MSERTATNESLISAALDGLGPSARSVDSRTRDTASLYIAALLKNSGSPKSFPELARLACSRGSPERRRRLASRFQYLVIDHEWNPDLLLIRLVEAMSPDVIWRIRVLTTVWVKPLWHARIHTDHAPRQLATHFRLVGNRKGGGSASVSLGWRLAVEDGVWGPPGRAGSVGHQRRMEAGIALDRSDKLGDLGHNMIDWSGARGFGGLPVVAGATYYATRSRWLQAGIEHVLECPPERGTWWNELRRAGYGIRPLAIQAPNVTEVFLAHTARRKELVIVARPPVVRQGRTLRTWITNRHASPAVAPGQIREVLRLGHVRFALHRDNLRHRDLGLDGYRGRSYAGWHRHAALVSVAFAASQY